MEYAQQIRCTFSDIRHNEKPKKPEDVKRVQATLKPTDITIEQLAEALVHGCSFRPGVLEGRKASDWKQQQLFGLDFDDGMSIEVAYKKVTALGIVPVFMYTTFSHTPEHHKFRMIFCNNTVITDGNLRDKLQATLMGVMGEVDPVCKNRDRLFFGGKSHEVLYPDYNSRIQAEEIIQNYWKDEYAEYIPGVVANNKKKNSTTLTAKSKKQVRQKKTNIAIKDNTDAISTLNISLLQERLGLKEVLCDTDKENTLFISITKIPQEENTSINTENMQQFQSEGDMYDYINSIDLHEYLGVPDGMFKCILPEHEDSKPSANIYTSDSGTQLYKCFGCGQTRTIISMTEHLAHCKRHEAIEFIKKVYGLEYKPSEWVEQQRRLMIDSALYLNSEEFQKTFPNINKLIRTRKSDIQNILFHMTKYISDGMQYDGKPLFFASIPSLMKVCNRNNRNIMSQSITLFALLNMLNKVELNCIPAEELDKAKSISAKYGFKKLTNFYQVEEYGYTSLGNSEKIAETLIENNISLKGLSREYVLRTFGIELADKVFPQYKSENRKGLSEKSDKLTADIALVVLETIKQQGYILEKDINIPGSVGNQWKKSIQEILDAYGLKRVRLNKELKERFEINGNGYPFIITEDS